MSKAERRFMLIRKRISGVVLIWCSLAFLGGAFASVVLAVGLTFGYHELGIHWSVIPVEFAIPVALVEMNLWVPLGTIAMLMGALVCVHGTRGTLTRSMMGLYRYYSLVIGLGWPASIFFLVKRGMIQLGPTTWRAYDRGDIENGLVMGLIVLLPLVVVELSSQTVIEKSVTDQPPK